MDASPIVPGRACNACTMCCWMLGIKEIVETGSRGRLANHVHVTLWTLTFLTFVAAAVLVMRAQEWGRALVGFALAGIVFQVLTLGQPPAAVGLTLVWMLFAFLWWPLPYHEPTNHKVATGPNAASLKEAR